jgi:hypothetical protein
MTEHWIGDDHEFARQRLGANNPNVMSRFQGSSQNLTAILDNGSGASDMNALRQQLENARSQNQLFVCDYTPVLGQVNTIRDGQYFTVPIVFFTVDSTQALIPATIQLRRDEYWFTPADGMNAWLLAKLYAVSADAQWWYSGTHLFNTHSINMIFGIATYASGFADNPTHPIYTLIHPHLIKVYDINTAVYNAMATSDANNSGLYQKEQGADQSLPTGRIGIYELINALYQDYDFEQEAFPNVLNRRGLDTASFPYSFPYRDDGQIWWSTLSTFVSDIVDATYSTDTEVTNDQALINWLSTVEAAFNHDDTIRFSFNQTKEQLKSILTNLIFLVTAQHTAVNNTMFDGLALVSNGAFAMKQAAPVNADNITDDMVYDSLPDPQDDTDIGFQKKESKL